MTNTLVNIGLYVTYGLFLIAIVTMLFFSIRQFIDSIGKSKVSLFAMVGLVAVFAISYVCSSPTDVSAAFLEKTSVTESTSKMVGSGLMMFYILFFATLIVLVATEIARPFKK